MVAVRRRAAGSARTGATAARLAGTSGACNVGATVCPAGAVFGAEPGGHAQAAAAPGAPAPGAGQAAGVAAAGGPASAWQRPGCRAAAGQASAELSVLLALQAAGLRKQFGLPESRWYWLRLAVLAEARDWQALESFAAERKSPIGWVAGRTPGRRGEGGQGWGHCCKLQLPCGCAFVGTRAHGDRHTRTCTSCAHCRAQVGAVPGSRPAAWCTTRAPGQVHRPPARQHCQGRGVCAHRVPARGGRGGSQAARRRPVCTHLRGGHRGVARRPGHRAAARQVPGHAEIACS